MASETSRAPRVPIWITTLSGNAYIILGTLLFSVLALLTFWIPPRGHVVQVWARAWSRGLLWFSGVRVRAWYETELADGQPYVFMANHQSLFDIPVLIATLPSPALFMAKQELFRIPFFGWAIRAGGLIPVDRRDQRRARESFRQAVRRLESGASIVLFPEETRSTDGRLLAFKRGGFLLARKARTPIVPVGIDGTLQVQERSSYGIRSASVEVRYGRALHDTTDGGDLPDRVRTRVSELARTSTTD